MIPSLRITDCIDESILLSSRKITDCIDDIYRYSLRYIDSIDDRYIVTH